MKRVIWIAPLVLFCALLVWVAAVAVEIGRQSRIDNKSQAETESIEIDGLPPGTKEAIEELGRSKGKSAEEYLRTLIETQISSARLRQDDELRMKQELESWEAASDEDWLKLEGKVAEVE